MRSIAERSRSLDILGFRSQLVFPTFAATQFAGDDLELHRNLFFTPFPREPVGWMIEQCGDDLFLFSSYYPHPEGTKDPIKRFEETMDGVSGAARDAFYRGNYARMMGWE